MLASTIELIRAGLKTDPTLSPAECSRLMVIIRHHDQQIPIQPTKPTTPDGPKVIRRKQAAERLNRSLRFVDMLAKQGVLKKYTLPGRKRAVGILESSFVALLATPPDTK